MLNEYIKTKYDNSPYWFIDEVKQSYHMQRISKVLDNKSYLDGKHKILKRDDEVYNSRYFETRKTILNYCKPILTFQTSFLLKNPVTLTSDDMDTLEVYKNIYKTSKYNNMDFNILDKLLKYGEVYEYVYFDGDKIKSKLINAEDSYPVYNHKGDYIAYIEHYTTDSTPYYIVYTDNTVTEYILRNEDIVVMVAEYNNITGLPIRYLLPSEEDEFNPRSDLEEWKNIIDDMEDIISKYTDSFYKFLNPIPVMKGNKLSVGDNGEGAINPNIVGYALQIDHDSDFDFKIAKMDYQTFKELYKTLHQNLLNISMTPSISMNSAEISNISETSMKILFYMAISKGAINSKHLHRGFDERWKKIKKVLRLIDKDYIGYVDCSFKFDIPQNDTEIINNLKTLHDMGKVSTETILTNNPYVSDIIQEMNRLDSVVDSIESDKDNREVVSKEVV